MVKFVRDLMTKGRIAVVKIRRNENLQSAKRKVSKFPNGLMAPLPAILSLVAWCLTVASAMHCVFAWKTVEITGKNQIGDQGEGLQIIQDHGVGMYGWKSNGECHNYEINGNSPSFDGLFTTANCFTTFTVLLGGVSMVTSILGTVFPVEPLYYVIIGSFTLVIAGMSISALCFLSSNICDPNFFNYATEDVDLSDFTISSCKIARGGILSLLASIFWFIAAGSILATNLSKLSRVPTPFRGAPLDHFGNDDDGDESDGGDLAPRTAFEKRQEEMYLQMFGDANTNSITDGKSKESKKDKSERAVEERPDDEGTTKKKPTEEYEDEYDIGDKRRKSQGSLRINEEERSVYSETEEFRPASRSSIGYDDDYEIRTADFEGGLSADRSYSNEEMVSLAENSEIV